MLTYASCFEKGRPLSRAKAHVSRDVDARQAKIEPNAMMRIPETMAEVAAFD